MKGPDDHEFLADLYLATVVRAQVEGRWVLAHHAAAKLGTVYVLTAWNLGHDRPSRAANDAANEALRQLLESEGCQPLPALGSDPASDHAEESWCVTGLSDRRAREIGAQFGQWAVFRITPTEQTVLGCIRPALREGLVELLAHGRSVAAAVSEEVGHVAARGHLRPERREPHDSDVLRARVVRSDGCTVHEPEKVADLREHDCSAGVRTLLAVLQANSVADSYNITRRAFRHPWSLAARAVGVLRFAGRLAGRRFWGPA